ncbi:MAG: metal ABC transporter ATP-binding protein [Candidatus Yanofskybacteria bacterium]|nr:metal ABC transporter ATP-binding protein [Candidatus Yanofskybacteria bacterium]
MADSKVLEVEDLSVEFDGQKVLENINFNVSKSEVLAVIGPNGSGKSVMFRALLGLIPYSGKITWQKGLKISYAPQKLSIEHGLPLTVSEFLMLKTQSREKIINALASVGIDTGPEQEHHLEHHILNRRMGLLSGGEFQRILVAWALINDPDVLLFDEPTTGIDIGGEETIYNLLHELQDKRKLTVVLISHDLNIVYKYAKTVICLNRQQVCFGEPHTVLNPEELSSLYGGEAKFYHHNHPSGEN